jgi:hypothetical protein
MHSSYLLLNVPNPSLPLLLCDQGRSVTSATDLGASTTVAPLSTAAHRLVLLAILVLLLAPVYFCATTPSTIAAAAATTTATSCTYLLMNI